MELKAAAALCCLKRLLLPLQNKLSGLLIHQSMLVNLGKFPLPVEVIPFGSNHLFKRFIESGYNPAIRKNGSEIYITDSGNEIIDLHLNEIEDSIKLRTRD